MQHSNRWLIVFLVIAGLLLTACAKVAESAAVDKPALVEKIEGTDLNRVVLTERAAQRLDIQTAPIHEEQVKGTLRKVIPYAAVLYDPEGNTWTYTNAEPLTFVRQPITVDRIQDGLAVLVDGPASGTEVVTVGAEELYGAESEFEEE